jgi:hypothetical protein
MIAYRAKTTLVSASGTSLSLAIPTAEYGDALLMAILVAGGTGITITPPADWELVLRTDSTTVISVAVYRHRYLSGSTTPVVFTITSAAALAALTAWGGVDQISAVDVSGGQANASSANCVAPSVTTTKTDAQLVGLFAAATTARTATPPSGWTERLDIQGAALGFSLADVRQGTLGASGTKTATLSGAEVNIGTLVALAPSAINTPTEVRDDGNWSLAGWESRFASEAAMSAFVERQIHRANAELENELPDGFYPANLLTAPWLTLFQHAELHRTQSLLLTAAAAVAEASDDNSPNPFFGSASALLTAAGARLGEYQAVIERARREEDETLAAAPPTTRAGFRAVMRRRLNDPQGVRYTNDQLNDACWMAFTAYNRQYPRQATATIAAVTDQREYALASYTGFRKATRVEYPTGEEPASYLDPRAPDDPEGFWGERFYHVLGGTSPATLVIGEKPTTGESIGLTYEADHTYPTADGTTWTIPAHDAGWLVDFGEQYLMRGRPRIATQDVPPPGAVESAREAFLRAALDRENRGS